ncbi:MAG: UDP-3-O-(3-hydroxymyristoyl)glucosamine N-acyltransferase, partial [Gemmatimonadota bacterium]|nr:UDP-3-O-(3-hydroxymyristoyl)glucosamine N-acyltransferase [Gemmatimonadota bacterium]
LSAAAVAHLVGGTLSGDGDRLLRAVAPLDRAAADELSFVAHARYLPALGGSMAGAVLVSPELADAVAALEGRAARIVVANPYEAILKVLPALYESPRAAAGIDPTARLGRHARLGADASIGAYVVIEEGVAIGDGVRIDAHCVVGRGVRIGAGSHLYPAVTLYPGTEIGERVVLHSGARIGSDGFGYVYRDGVHHKVPHVGRCMIEDDVEVGANTTIDRGSIDDTVIGAGTKIDNLVHIAHNVRIGRLCYITAQVGIAGSTRVGDGVSFGGQAGINGHIAIGSGARIAGQAGVFGDVPAGESWSGYPARPHAESLRLQAAINKLAGMAKRIMRLVERGETGQS